jgi:hypothetical protein
MCFNKISNLSRSCFLAGTAGTSGTVILGLGWFFFFFNYFIVNKEEKAAISLCASYSSAFRSVFRRANCQNMHPNHRFVGNLLESARL